MCVWIPWFQPLFFHMFYTNAGLWLVWLIILAIAVLLGCLAGGLAKSRSVGWKTGGILLAIGFFGFWIAYGVLGGAWTEQKIYQSLEYTELNQLPDTTGIRYLPMEVAWRQGENRLQDARVQHVDADPIIVGDEVQWVLTRGPKGFWNKWLDNASGFTMVDSRGDISTIRQKMTYGEGMLGSDHIYWKLRQQRYWSKVTEIYYVQDENNGEVVAVAPYIDYSLNFPVMVPKWGGVFLVYSDGKIEDLSPQEAQKHPLLKDLRVFPEELARIYTEAYAYKNGIANAIFRHKDQIEIPSVSVGSAATDYAARDYRVNEMPFLLPTEAGQKWFVAAVPWGAEGIYRIFLVDAVTGKVEMFALPQDSSLVGPNRARGYVTCAYPYFDWDKFLVLEPRPIMKEGAFYWMFTITPTNFAGITDTVLVNARTNEVFSFGSDKDTLIRFLHGEETGKLVGIGESSLLKPSIPGILELSAIGELTPEEIQQLIDQLRQSAATSAATTQQTIEFLERLKQSLSK